MSALITCLLIFFHVQLLVFPLLKNYLEEYIVFETTEFCFPSNCCPPVPAPISGPCLQLLLWCPHSKCPLPSSPYTLNWSSFTVWNSLSFLVYLYIYSLMDIYFVPWVIIQYFIYFCFAQIVSASIMRSSFRLASVSF